MTTDAVAVKMPPHDLDSEEAVLGSCLIDPEAIYKVNTLLLPNDFYRDKHRWTYNCILKAIAGGTAINQITIAHELAKEKRLEAVGGADYLSHLISNTPTSIHIDFYAGIVRKLAFMRRIISAADRIAAIGYEMPEIEDALHRIESIYSELRNMSDNKNSGFKI